MTSNVPEFGRRVDGRVYRTRPGAYGIIDDGQGRMAVVVYEHGYFLPGGGIDPGETAVVALIREVREECGAEISDLRHIGDAIELVFAAAEGHFAKPGAFFQAVYAGPSELPSSEEGRVVWLAPAEAIVLLTHGSQRWATGRCFGLPLPDMAPDPGPDPLQ